MEPISLAGSSTTPPSWRKCSRPYHSTSGAFQLEQDEAVYIWQVYLQQRPTRANCHHSMDQNLDIRMHPMCQRRAIAVRSLGHVSCRWKLAKAAEWWLEVEHYDSDLLTGATDHALDDTLG